MTSTIKVDNIQNQCGANIINESSNTITIGASGDTVSLASGASQSGFGRTGTVNWDTTAKTASFTATSGEGYFVNTTSGAITVTLPASPSANDIVSVADYAGTWDNNACTIARNGSNINGEASDLVRSANRGFTTLIYVDGTQGWVLTDQSGTDPEYIVATGGTITTCGNFKIHTFTGPGTFTVCSVGNDIGSNTVDYLVVAGGGGGQAFQGGGGGGAGGYRESSGAASGCYSRSPLGACVSALPVSAQGYPITVGGGGAARTHTTPGTNQVANPGNNSVFSTITSAGGGGGGSGGGGTDRASGASGGSGGAAGGRNNQAGGAGNTPPVSPPQGNPGGNAKTPDSPTEDAGGGGGGALGAGGQAPAGPEPVSPGGGVGGQGATSSINGTPTTRAGGGGGGSQPAHGPGGPAHPGGGGGGAGTTGNNPNNGTDNTGGGGGGGGSSGFPATGSSGGSGIVIIRYKFQ